MSSTSTRDALAVDGQPTLATELPDIIAIKQLKVRMVVGVDNWERVQAQPVTIDASVHTDVSKAGSSDHLPYSIHYGVLVKQLEAHCAQNRYRSLEALAEGLAKVCIFNCHAPRVTLNVEKPRSLLHAKSAGVQIVRTAQDYVDPQGVTASVDTQPSELASLRLSPSSSWATHDKVIVRDLVINTILGVNPWEREDRQDVRLNLVIYSGLERLRQASRKTSGVADVVNRPHNYRTIVRSISDYVEASSYKTVESLATSIARVAIMQNRVERIKVRVDKPSAIMYADSAGVEVDRSRSFFEEEANEHVREPETKASSVHTPSSQLPTPVSRAASDSKVMEDDHLSNLTDGKAWHVAAIALGSNLGDRASNIEKAVQALEASDGCKVVDTSFLYETAPMYMTEQPSFLNAACRIATTLSPSELLDLTQSIEIKLGRDKTGVPEKGPRLVDLDILLYDQIELDESPRLVIPHPGIKEREFVLEPLSDILPEYEHPTHSRTIAQLLTMLQKSPDYVPSGIRRVLALPSPVLGTASSSSTRLQTSSLWAWGSKTFIMGIINATPDSFSDGGDNASVENALSTATAMVRDGADLLDIGGMSTAPNADEVSPQEEIDRVVPVISKIRSAGIMVPISIDTFRAEVAKAALEAGANMINDVTGGERDPEIFKVAKTWNVPYVLMHMRGDSKTMGSLTEYESGDVVSGVRKELEERVGKALRSGLRRWNMILDPGLGFAKDPKGNVDLIRDLSRLNATTNTRSNRVATIRSPGQGQQQQTSGLVSMRSSLSSIRDRFKADRSSESKGIEPDQGGSSPDEIEVHVSDLELASRPVSTLDSFPVLLGPSRKRFLATITGRKEPKERVYATAAASAAAIAGGVDILRVHDVREMVDVARMSDAIYRTSQSSS
ncbi:Dihydropteroate synthase [Violaceomyces palustris]|uniref:Dihydropteroate synthase n=1 Tax=Violaceomyces palustris TaxID=1673888 RepID=A0ACD0P8K6_9BASI|nr:Dihydropteroate synthase [Violaceomyces palustris]